MNNINLSIECGKKAAFVGLSGSGKSTLINLLLRFYDNYSGEISIDQKDIKSLSLFDLRENISLITRKLFYSMRVSWTISGMEICLHLIKK